jgi:protein ImuB
MARLACISLPALPLQLALRGEPELREPELHGQPVRGLRELPVAVVESERAQALLLWVNGAAWRKGVRPGMRHAAALSLCGNLRARVVAAEAIEQAVRELTVCLRRFSPHVEPSAEEPGVFWLSGLGLKRLFGRPAVWADAIHHTLHEEGWRAAVAVGHGHFTTYAAAQARLGVQVFRDAEAEHRAACQVPLERLALDPKDLEALDQLGLARLGDLLRLPSEGLPPRFGRRLYRLHRQASGALSDPLQPQPERLAVNDLLFVEPPERDAERLLFLIKGRLPFLLADLAARQEGLHKLRLELELDDHSRRALTVQPAHPTRQEPLILELVRLRLERLELSAGITEIGLAAEGRTRTIEQLSLLESGRKRDLLAANRALAQLRAEFGEQSVLRAVPREGHLPEARFAWEPLERLDWPRPRKAEHPALIRRLLTRPVPLPGWPRAGSTTARWKYDRAPEADGLVSLHGPFVVSGGWWGREQRRDYYLAEMRTGDVLWVYHDRRQGRWFRQGWVE